MQSIGVIQFHGGESLNVMTGLEGLFDYTSAPLKI